MFRGIITGLFFGSIVGLFLAAVFSLVTPLPSDVAVPQAPEPAATQPAAIAEPDFPDASAADAPVEADSQAQTPVPAETEVSPPVADVTSAPKPAPAEVEDAPVAPIENVTAEVALEEDTPVLPNPQARPITTPGEETEPSISVDPAQPVSPTDIETQAFGSADTAEDAAPQPEVAIESGPAQTPPSEAAQITPDATEETPPAVDVTVDVAPEMTAPEESPSLLQPVPGLLAGADERRSTRLPTVADAGAEPAESAALQNGEVNGKELHEDPPLVAYATPYEDVAGKPIMSVVLLDNPAAGVAELKSLADFPLPLSIAVDALSEGAATRSKKLRDAGFEVLALVNLPSGATPSDVSLNLTAQIANVPEAVAIMDGLQGGLQDTREIADQVIDYALSSGHGLVFQPKGLNTSQKLALREGVGTATVFRDFDGSGQTEVVIRRFFDQAAFKARQNEAVLMMGRLESSTIAALASWALQDRANTVTVAPVSALLQLVMQ
ncbi:divergent polysaccharide deacetylase family protein [Cognatishimia maritima]|uniref:Uncharacterized conserved protein YibQ, putative polysaccharide deacetylase 2 family n=1 Tax=Cognatishimia maritima TaxID=870908 RepID=A0A1M5J839_9RHOB|nr:divergent polysaccharide deacetylase family protein [Cognatishimia maritima]SHG36728.1 Uncharacterized conserved protein YibQ, putative polysaccharide deacetylase 2 family [Cognatishimia maritima]